MQLRRNKKSKAPLIITLLFATGLICFGAWGAWQWWQATHNPNPTILNRTITHSTNEPDETKPHCDDSYQVPANQPRKIEIPNLKKSGCIQRVGIDQNKAMAVPTNIHVAGWYVNSAVPGEQGVSVIDGHVSGRYEQNAIFANIKDLQKGDVIKVQLGNKSWREFSVVSVDSYSVEQTAKEQMKQLDGVERQLTLITCGGNFDTNSQQYDERVVVRAEAL